jgi:23S rRNA (cytosine1962-C5)-methyltransferase
VRRLVLRPGRDAPVRGGHPWIFSGAIAGGLEGAEPGEAVAVHAASGRFVAAGYANPRTPIAVRVCTLADEAVDARLVERRIADAVALRGLMLPPDAEAYRVVNGEGDRLPGVVVDRYGEFLVCQLLTAGAARLAAAVVGALEAQLAPRGIFERSEGSVRAEEGLPGTRGVLAGETPPASLAIREHGARFLVDVHHGQKTGFFLDQRETRARLRTLAAGRRVLNAFAYTGAFGIVAALAGARAVVSVDASRPALELAEAAWRANDLPDDAATFIAGDVFDWLRAPGDPFELIVLDPPAFVRRRRDVQSGLRGYKDVNLQAFRRLAPGGLLLTCSCSQHLDAEAFRDVVRRAAADAGRAATVLAEWAHPPDHPVALAHPEGRYLKVLLLQG